MQYLTKAAAMIALSAPLALAGCVTDGSDDALDEAMQPDMHAQAVEMVAPGGSKMNELPAPPISGQGPVGLAAPPTQGGLAAPPTQGGFAPQPGCVVPTYSAPSCSAPVISAPSYGAPSFGAPSYNAPEYKAPNYQAPSYQAPSQPPLPAPVYTAPSYPGPIFQAPVYEAPTYAAPIFPAPIFQAPTYQAPNPLLPANPPVCGGVYGGNYGTPMGQGSVTPGPSNKF